MQVRVFWHAAMARRGGGRWMEHRTASTDRVATPATRVPTPRCPRARPIWQAASLSLVRDSLVVRRLSLAARDICVCCAGSLPRCLSPVCGPTPTESASISRCPFLVWPSRRLPAIDSRLSISLRMLAVLLPPTRVHALSSGRRYAPCMRILLSVCVLDLPLLYAALQSALCGLLAAPRSSISRIRRSSRQDAAP